MRAMQARSSSHAMSVNQLRPLVGAQVAAYTLAGSIEGTLLSCTARSAWIVAGDVDHVLALPSLLAVRRR